MAPGLIDAAKALRSALRDLLAVDVDAATTEHLLSSMDLVEECRRSLPAVEHRIVNRVAAEVNPIDLGATSVTNLLAYRMRISAGEAARRTGEAGDLGTRRALTGERLAPVLAQTAAAQAGGTINAEHVAIIRRFFAKLPDHVDLATREAAEADLVRIARDHGPAGLRKAADLLTALLHPDGDFTDADRERQRAITLSQQRPDGMSSIRGDVTPELRAVLEAVLAKLAAPGMCNPADATPTVDGDPAPDGELQDHRSPAQRNHDALLAVGRMALCSGDLGKLNGLPVTVVVSTTLQELESAAGQAVTAGGTLLPMRDLIAMAAHAHHYLYVYDSHTSETLYLGRTKRCANAAQRIVLHARDRGCTRPGCLVDGYHSQVHHAAADWKNGGSTDVDDLTFACGRDNRLIERTDWVTRKRKDGRTEWIPPPELDTGQARVNDLHHPARLLQPLQAHDAT